MLTNKIIYKKSRKKVYLSFGKSKDKHTNISETTEIANMFEQILLGTVTNTTQYLTFKKGTV